MDMLIHASGDSCGTFESCKNMIAKEFRNTLFQTIYRPKRIT